MWFAYMNTDRKGSLGSGRTAFYRLALINLYQNTKILFKSTKTFCGQTYDGQTDTETGLIRQVDLKIYKYTFLT